MNIMASSSVWSNPVVTLLSGPVLGAMAYWAQGSEPSCERQGLTDLQAKLWDATYPTCRAFNAICAGGGFTAAFVALELGERPSVQNFAGEFCFGFLSGPLWLLLRERSRFPATYRWLEEFSRLRDGRNTATPVTFYIAGACALCWVVYILGRV